MRLETMVRTNDGFEIAEVDMKLRGPGDIEGTQQSGIGFDLKLANLGKDGEILQLARNETIDILKNDPKLEKPENILLRKKLLKSNQTTFNWSSIS
jgi:ATP-dependent DNA helicase RecG